MKKATKAKKRKGARLRERVERSPVYPASGPWPDRDAPILTEGELGHANQRTASQAKTLALKAFNPLTRRIRE